MKIESAKVAGWTLIGLGLSFCALVLVETRSEVIDGSSFYPHLTMLFAGVLALAGLSYLIPGLFVSVAIRLIVVRAMVTGKEPPDVHRLENGLEFITKPMMKSEVDAEANRYPDVPGKTAPPPMADEWNSTVRPVLHQASQYMAPTYYLNGHLQVIDWNLCFELIFDGIIGELRGRHVNWFIARLRNSEAVFGHARNFPDKVEKQPQVDVEPLLYVSKDYGPVEFEKVATKLHDLQGRQRGWAVTLMVRKLEAWDKLIGDLKKKIEDDKFWSIYSVSYDRVLNHYPGYDQLLRSVIRAIPDSARRVVDLGAGTGNASKLLLDRADRSVWAVEKNMAMLDLLRAKDFVARAGDRFKIVKSSVEHLEMLAYEDPYDAAVAVNVLYAVDNVPDCLTSLNRVLKMGATFSLSTTYDETKLGPLLADIRSSLGSSADWNEMASHYARVQSLNMKLEENRLTTRYSREQYLGWLEAAGFHVEQCEPGHYQGAVLLIRAVKVADIAPPEPRSEVSTHSKRQPVTAEVFPAAVGPATIADSPPNRSGGPAVPRGRR